MAVELVMPRLSESMEEGTVVSWLVADGALVARGQEIAEIETDKATLPYEAPESGVLRILVPEGTTLPLGSPIGLIDDLPAYASPPQPAGPVDDDPPTESHAAVPDPAAAGGGATQAWSPAWGPQPTPAGAPPQRPVAPPALQHPAHAAASGAHPEDEGEGETTEFDAVSLSGVLDEEPHSAAPVAPPAAPVAPTSPATPWITPTGQPSPPVAPAQPVAAVQPVEPVEPLQPPVAPAPLEPAVDPSADDERRYAPEELMTPPTLAPRPPELQAAPSATSPRVIASPVARRLAGELGIDLSTLTGTGPEGRIVRADIEAAQAEGAARPPLPAAAAPTAASEFTPPVDDVRAAAPIPAAEPQPASEPEATPEPEPEPTSASDAPEPEPGADSAPAAESAPAEPAPDVAPTLDFADEPTSEAEAVPQPDALADEVVLPEPESTVDPSPDSEAPLPGPDPVEAEPEPEPVADPVVIEPDPALEPDPAAEPEPVAAAEPAPSETRVMTAAQPGGGKGEPQIVELTRQQQTVARRMAESKATIPDYTTTVEVDADPLLTLRADLITTRPDLAAPSVNDLLVKAVAIALRAFPRLNGGYRDGRLELYPRVNVGIATDAEGSLLVPVIHDADQLSVAQIAARTGELLGKASSGGLRPPDIASATFTISNLGMYGVDEFTAVITPGQAAILTAGAITERPVVRNGAVVAGQTLRLTLTTDHRAVYGLEAAKFLGRVRQLIEHPSSLLA